MKPVLPKIFLLLLCLVLPLLLSACGEKEEPCTHENLSNWIIDKSATCQVQGIRHKECLDCGEIVKTESYHVGHQYENNVCIWCGRARYDEQYMKYEPYTVDGTEGYIVTDMGNCASQKLVIPETYKDKPVLAIGERAFYLREKVTDVFIPKTVVLIGDEAFRGCKNLKTVTFTVGSACTSLGAYAFGDCPALVSCTVPQGVTRLPNGLFAGDENLEELLLHDGITAVGVAAFDGCYSLLTNQKNGAAYLGNGENRYFLLLSVTDRTITSLTPEPGMKIVAAYAFAGCRDLTTLTLPDGVISLCEHAFDGCMALETVLLPDTLTTIGDYAFAGCAALTELTLPAGLMVLGECAFQNCTALTALTLPHALGVIGRAAFYGCTALTGVTLNGSFAVAETSEGVRTPVTPATPAEAAEALTVTYLDRYWFRIS